MKELLELSNKVISLKRNEFLVFKGDRNSNLYYVNSGSLRIYILDNQEEKNIRFGYKDNYIAALDSFLSGCQTTFYIQVIKKTELRVISKEQISHFLENTSYKKLWNTLMEQLILDQLDREIDLLTTAPKERYERVLKRSPRLFQEIPHKYIANYLRMSPETLSRLKKS